MNKVAKAGEQRVEQKEVSWATIARWQIQQAKNLLKMSATTLNVRRRRLSQAEGLLTQLQAKYTVTYRLERANLWEDLAAEWFQVGNITRAEFCLRQMACLQPGCADAYLNLGYYLSTVGLVEKAKLAYWEGLDVNPGDQFIVYNLATLYIEAGQQQKALELLDRAISTSCEPGVVLKSKADLLRDWGRLGMAALTYELALEHLGERWPDFRREIIRHLAECYQIEGRMDAAITTWERALNLVNIDQEARYNLVLLNYQQQKWLKVINYGNQYDGEHQEEVKKLVFCSYQCLNKTASAMLSTVGLPQKL